MRSYAGASGDRLGKEFNRTVAADLGALAFAPGRRRSQRGVSV